MTGARPDSDAPAGTPAHALWYLSALHLGALAEAGRALCGLEEADALLDDLDAAGRLDLGDLGRLSRRGERERRRLRGEPPAAEREPTPRERALRYYRSGVEREAPEYRESLRRRGLLATLLVPAVDARALQWDEPSETWPDGRWEIYRVEREPSDLPGRDKWRLWGGDSSLTLGPFAYLPEGSTADDAWRRFFPREVERLVTFDAADL